MGVAMADRAKRADEFLTVLKKAWTDDVVEFTGRFFRVPPSIIDLKPVQRPHPPIYLAAFSPGAMKRLAETADGWTPVAVPTSALPSMRQSLKEMAAAAGRDPDAIRVVVRGNVHLTAEPLEERYPFVGSWEQVLADIEETRQAGADELFIDPQGTPPDEFLRVMERIRNEVR